MAATLITAPVEEDLAPEIAEALSLHGLTRAAGGVAAAMRAEDAVHGWDETAHILHIDPVPRVIPGDEWAVLADGLAQRVIALEAFLHDLGDRRRVLSDGVVPPDLLDGSEW